VVQKTWTSVSALFASSPGSVWRHSKPERLGYCSSYLHVDIENAFKVVFYIFADYFSFYGVK
jgi:hypothetical protein